MKRAFLFGLTGLASALAGYIVLAPGTADAGGSGTCSYLYSTGPMENAIGFATPATSDEIVFKVLNNDTYYTAHADLRVYALNGSKILLDSASVDVPPGSSTFHFSDVDTTVQWEAQIEVTGYARPNTLVAVFGKDEYGELVAAHRVVHSEMKLTKTSCSDW